MRLGKFHHLGIHIYGQSSSRTRPLGWVVGAIENTGQTRGVINSRVVLECRIHLHTPGIGRTLHGHVYCLGLGRGKTALVCGTGITGNFSHIKIAGLRIEEQAIFHAIQAIASGFERIYDQLSLPGIEQWTWNRQTVGVPFRRLVKLHPNPPHADIRHAGTHGGRP